MSERIDVLMPVMANCPSFTVDTTGPLFVEVTPAAAPVAMMSADVLTSIFRRGDNITVLSMGYFIPDNFITYELAGPQTVPAMTLFANRQTTLDNVRLFQFGANGIIRSPFPNYEMALGVFLDVESFLGEAFKLSVMFDVPGRISMIGVPASLNALVFHVVPFLKVLHTFVLTA